MFTPKYIITPRILANIKQIATLTVELNHRPPLPVVFAEMEKRAVTLSAHTSTRIEGNPLPLTEVKRLLRTRPDNLRDSEREVINYNQALEHLNQRVSDGLGGLELQEILQIHRTVTQGLLESYYCGRLREEPVVVNNPRTGETVYHPPDHTDVKSMIEELTNFIENSRNKMDPLILAGLFHKQFVIIHPFTDGNGRTARLGTKMLLAAIGVDTFPLFSFENYYNRNVSKYFNHVGVVGNYYDIRDKIDFTPWLEYFTDGIIDELLRVSEEFITLAASPENTLQPHHNIILEIIRQHGYVTDRLYAARSTRAKSTRALDFNKLTMWGLIKRCGGGRNTHYKLQWKDKLRPTES
jgi:Fic family protein